jgi:maleate cis-trans isomerase
MSWKVLVSAPYFQPVVKDFMGWFDEHGIEVPRFGSVSARMI